MPFDSMNAKRQALCNECLVAAALPAAKSPGAGSAGRRESNQVRKGTARYGFCAMRND